MSSAPPSEWPLFVLFAATPCLAALLLWRFTRTVRQGRLSNPSQRLLLGNLLVFLLLGSTAFLILEAWFRFVRDTTDSFNYSKTSQRWFERHYRMNNFGMRDNVRYEFAIAPGKRRVTVIGDSFTVGQGIKDVEDRFANILRRTAPDLEVHVLAVPGFETGDQIALLRQLTTNGYQLDVVLLAYCLNDISDLVPAWQETLARINAGLGRQGWLTRNSYFANAMHYRLKALRDPDIPDYFGVVKDAYAGPAWAAQMLRLQELKQLAERQGGRFAVVTFPFFHALGRHYPWHSVHEQLASFWHQHHVKHLDLHPVYHKLKPDDLMVNSLDAHPNELAHLMAADAILKFLDEKPRR